MHYVKYNARIPGLLCIPTKVVELQSAALSASESSTAVPVHRSKTASHSHCFIALLIAS